jgi:hypothetical protein
MDDEDHVSLKEKGQRGNAPALIRKDLPLPLGILQGIFLGVWEVIMVSIFQQHHCPNHTH